MIRRRGSSRTTTPACVMAILLFVGCERSTSEKKSTIVKPEPTGQVSESECSESEKIVLLTTDEKQFAEVLKKHQGRVVLVEFWATWCAELLPHSVALQQRLAEKGLTVITVSCDHPDERDNVLSTLRENNARLENYITPYPPIVATGVFAIDDDALPHFRLYDRSGTLRRKFVVDLEPWTVESLDLAVETLIVETLILEP